MSSNPLSADMSVSTIPRALAWSLVRLTTTDKPLDGELDGLSDAGRALVGRIQDLPRAERLPNLATHASAAGLDYTALINAMMSLKGSDPLPAEAPCLVPVLPEAARLDPDLGRGTASWLSSYRDYASSKSPMTPAAFHESAGLWLASVAIARRLRLGLAHGDVYPNLYIAWVAPTTLWGKTTAGMICHELAREVFPYLLAPQDMTPESFLSDLSGDQPRNLELLPSDVKTEWSRGRNFAAQRGLFLDEFSRLLASAGRDYNAGLIEAFLMFHDCHPRYVRSTRGQGLIVVRDSYLSFLGASTPRALSSFLTDERLWSMGWWPRIAILTPETERPEWREARDVERPHSLAEDLRKLHERLPEPQWPEPPRALAVTLGDGVHAAWMRYDKACRYDLLTGDLDTRLWGCYGRMPTQTIKVAVLLAALDWADTPAPRVELSHLSRAMAITEGWRASAHRALGLATQSDYGDMRGRIIRLVSKSEPGGATVRDLTKGMRDKKPDEITDAIRQMVAAGDIEELSTRGSGPGQPTTKYRASQ